MKRLLLVGLAMGALASCATPTYPVKQGYVAPPPIKPTYPARQDAPAAQAPGPQPDSAPSASKDSAAQTESAPAGSAAAPSPAPVESTPLSPISTAPEPQAAPLAAAPPPAAAPATRTPPPRPAASPPPTAPQAYEPPAPRYRRPEVRYVTDGKVVAARGMYRDYEVQKGDHLDAIARDLQTTRHELIEANHLRSPYRLRPGDHIKTPVAKAYVVAGGDTLGAVAKRFGVSLGELSNLNDLPERGRLTPGMFVALPAHYEDHGPTRITVTEEAYVAPRPRATYTPAAPSQYTPPPGPYSPSPEALAAAAARQAQGAQSPSSAPNFSYERPRTTAPLTPAEPPANSAALASLGQGKFIWPVKGQILSGFGAAGMGRRNDGLDIGAPEGSEVRAAAVGEVVYAGDQVPGFGNLVLIKHAGGWVSAYAHLASVNVHMRDTVYQGEQVGTVGSTGGVTQPQLHFELRYASSPADKAKPLDPLTILPR